MQAWDAQQMMPSVKSSLPGFFKEVRMEYNDLFGGVSEAKEPVKQTRRFKTMRDLHGTLTGQVCKTCIFLTNHHWNCRNYYKCSLWHVSCSVATDIRLSDKACGKWKARD